MIDARRQSSDSESESSRPVSTALHTKDTVKAGPKAQPQGRVSPRGFTGDESLRPSASPEESGQPLLSKTQTLESTKSVVQKRSSSSARDVDDMLSSLPGNRTWYSPRPKNDDAIQPPHSQYPMRYKSTGIGTNDIPGALPSPAHAIPGKSNRLQNQYGHNPKGSATYSGTRPPLFAARVRPIVRDHTTYNRAPGSNEYLPSKTDPSGETKVSKEGHPLEGRVFRFQTFQLPHRGDTLFMLGEECSWALGFGSSGLIFKYNDSLLKIIVSDTEKENLIQQGIVPESDISQKIAVVTARSMFRQFGASVIQNGRRVRDDYWEAEARKQGFTEEDAADETTPGAAKARQAREAMAAQASPQTLGDLWGGMSNEY